MANGMANMVNTMHKKAKKGKPSITTKKRSAAAAPARAPARARTSTRAPAPAPAPAADDMGLGGVINMGAKTIIGVGLLGGLAGAMGGLGGGGGGA